MEFLACWYKISLILSKKLMGFKEIDIIQWKKNRKIRIDFENSKNHQFEVPGVMSIHKIQQFPWSAFILLIK